MREPNTGRWRDPTAWSAWNRSGDPGSPLEMTSLAFLIDQLFSPAPGGMGTYVRELVPALTRAEPSLDIRLFHSRFDEPMVEAWTAAYPMHELDGTMRRLYPSWAMARRPALPEPIR